MVTFRKSLLLLAVIALMSTAANAQPTAFTCNANAGVPPTIRAEGLAELVGDLILSCTGGTPTPPGLEVPRMNFRIFLNTSITSRLLESNSNGYWNEALLLIDEPSDVAPRAQTLCGQLGGCSIMGVGAEPGVNYDNEPNMYQGTAVSTLSPTVEWLGVPIDPPGTQAVRTIRITNVRANASEIGLGGLLIPNPVVMYVSVTGSQSMPINNPQQTVAFVQEGMTFSAGSGSFLQCEEPGDGNPIDIMFEEEFATAFKKRNRATGANAPTATPLKENDLSIIYHTETGFYAPGMDVAPGGSLHKANEAGLASQGTRLVARFSGLPDGVDIYVSAVNIRPFDSGDVAGCDGLDSNPLCYNDVATIVDGADSDGAGGTPQALSTALGWDGLGTDDGLYPVAIAGNAGTATWEIIQDKFNNTGDVEFEVWVDYVPNSSAGIPGTGPGSVGGSYGPISTIEVATTADLQPRFVGSTDAEEFMQINSCATNLLWPYVTNQAGFDTGMVISNTSMDPFNTATQEGKCMIYYYGNSGGGNPPPMDTTPLVDAGGHAVWTLSSGGGVVPYGGSLTGTINSAPNFQGYVIAHCLFQYAHGYAFISDLGSQKLAQGYIALVMDSPIWGCFECEGLTRTGTKSEPLNQ